MKASLSCPFTIENRALQDPGSVGAVSKPEAHRATLEGEMAKPSERIASLDYLLSATEPPAPGPASSAIRPAFASVQHHGMSRGAFQPAQGSLMQGVPSCLPGAFQPMPPDRHPRHLGNSATLSWSQQGLKKAPVVCPLPLMSNILAAAP